MEAGEYPPWHPRGRLWKLDVQSCLLHHWRNRSFGHCAGCPLFLCISCRCSWCSVYCYHNRNFGFSDLDHMDQAAVCLWRWRNYGQVHRVVLSHLDYDGEGKILEVGCGSGALTIRSALTWPKAKVIGVDYWGAVYNYSKALCEKNAAREGVASRCVFQHGDAKQLDFPDESFDVVISNYVYHNVMGADMQKLLLESLRVLKKGGVFALNDDMKPKMYGDMEGFAQKLRDMGYEEVRLVDTAQEAFGSHRRAAMMMLGSSRLLVGRK